MCWVINFARKKHLIIDSEVWKGGERNFGAWRFEDFQEGDANKNHSRKKKKKQLAPVKKRMQTLFEGRNPSSNCVVFSGGKLLFCGSFNQVRKLKLRYLPVLAEMSVIGTLLYAPLHHFHANSREAIWIKQSHEVREVRQ